MAETVVTLSDDLLDVLVQTTAWKQLFGNCVAVPEPRGGCGGCGGRRADTALPSGVRDRVRTCLLNATPAQLSGLKTSIRADKLVVFTRTASGTLERTQI